MTRSPAPAFLLSPGPAAGHRRPVTQDNEPPGDFWPEVSTRYSQDEPAPTKLGNAQGRVLFEIFLILAAAAFFVGLVLWLIPAHP